jgi:hypothetical protein
MLGFFSCSTCGQFGFDPSGRRRIRYYENRAGFYHSRNAVRVRRGVAVHFQQVDGRVEQQVERRAVGQRRCRKAPRANGGSGCDDHGDINVLA